MKTLLACLLLTSSLAAAPYRNPVVPGDNPDPSVLRVGDDYYMTATSSDWGPEFPMFHSRDLINWQPVASSLLARPEWASGRFWAPELTRQGDQFLLYYVAQKKNGPLAVAVARSRRPEGPYLDLGPLVAQPAGSIDPVTVQDVDGKRFLVWKEDGNSRKLPTPIWAQPLSADGTKLEGTPSELIRNDQPWEGPLVEAPYLQRRGDYFYMFYAGNACCGDGCRYAVGVARAKNLLGPWEKHPQNPILAGNEVFKCPGHGSLVETPNGVTYFLYHAIRRDQGIYVGRQAMLDQVEWGSDGWPRIHNGQGPSESSESPLGTTQAKHSAVYQVTFQGDDADDWQHPQDNEPMRVTGPNGLQLQASGSGPAAGVWARRTESVNYRAVCRLHAEAGSAGLAAYGNRDSWVGLNAAGKQLRLQSCEGGKITTLATRPLPARDSELEMSCRDGFRFSFRARRPGGTWQTVGTPLERRTLPPWDLGVRVALISGPRGGAFRNLRIDWLR